MGAWDQEGRQRPRRLIIMTMKEADHDDKSSVGLSLSVIPCTTHKTLLSECLSLTNKLQGYGCMTS